MSSDPIVIEQSFDAPIGQVWKAITDKDQMRQWFFEPMQTFEAEVGFETQFNVHVEGKDYLHIWNVTDVIPQQRIAYRWRYGGHTGDSTVTWELTEIDDGTNLTLTHTGQETFVGDPMFSRENGIAGWTYFVQQSLKAYLSQAD